MTVRYAQEIPEVSSDRGDADVTLLVTEVPIQLFATTLTANRIITLPSADNYNGAWFKIVRTGLGAFTLDVGGLYTIPASTAAWVDVRHDGTDWQIHSVGRVSDVGALLAHEHDHIVNLVTDSRTQDDPATAYPAGYSVMLATGTTDAWDLAYDSGNEHTVKTFRANTAGGEARSIQEIEDTLGGRRHWRLYDHGTATWSSLFTLNLWNDIIDLPSTFPPEAHAASHKGDGSDPIDNATTSVAGLLSDTDKTKLDGIETGATADQTATEILDAVKTVDGSGSGLDADTLDGHDASYFAASSDTRIPTQDENDALVGTNGTPSTSNKYVTNSDSRNSDTRTPTDDSVTNAKVASGAAIAESKLNLASDAVAGTASRRTLGTGMQQAVAGNDSRLSDSRTPTSHATSHVTGGSDVIANAVASGNAGLLSGTDKSKLDGIETGATADQTASEILTAIKTVDGAGSGLDADLLDGTSSAGFAAASHSHLIADLPVADDGESNSAEVVRSNDARLSNSRTPTTHATSHVTGGSDVIANAVAGGNAGLMSGADKTKLDGVETGATADMTASEILTAVKTVDGTGSGLDADTLDGSDSSVFASAANLTAHIDDASDAHDASAISYAGGTGMSATDVETAIDELATEKSDTGHTHGGAAFTLTETEVNLGSSARMGGEFNITSSGLTTGKHVLIQQLNGPYTGKGTLADEAEMDALTVSGRVTNATTIQCFWKSATRVRGNFKFGYTVSA